MIAPSAERSLWFGSLRVLRDGRLRFSPYTFPGLHHVSVFHSMMQVSVLSGGREVLYLYLRRNRVISACFVFTLSPDQLRKAVRELSGVAGGLASWVIPALEWTQADVASVKDPQQARPDLLEIIPSLLEDCRELPVAEIWQRRRRALQRQWAERLREHPEDITEVSASWMLPEGFTLKPQGRRAKPSTPRKTVRQERRARKA